MSYSLSDLMQLVFVERGGAMHLHDGESPVLEIGGRLQRVEGPRLETGETQMLLRSIAPSVEFKEALRGCTVFEHRHSDAAHFQVTAFREDGRMRLELRRVI